MQGKSVDDLFLNLHSTFFLFTMQLVPTFACFDAVRNPKIEQDFQPWQQHLKTQVLPLQF